MYDTRDMQVLHNALIKYEQSINRPYLYELSCFPTCPPTPCALPISILQLTSLPSNTTPQHLSYILNALNGLDQIIGYIICSSSDGLSVYIGVKGANCNDVAISLLHSGLDQVSKDLTITPVPEPDKFLEALLDPNAYVTLSSVTCLPPLSSSSSSSTSRWQANRQDDDNTDNTIELSSTNSASLLGSFLQLMGTNSPYVALFLAVPYCKHQLYGLLDDYYDLYYTLSHFNRSNHTAASTIAKNNSQTITKSKSEANGCNNGNTQGENTSCNEGGYVNISGNTPINCFNQYTVTGSLLKNKAKATVSGKSCSVTDSTSQTTTHSHSNAQLCATNTTDSKSINFSSQDLYVENALSKIENEITRLHTLIQSHCFNFNAYFLSCSCETALRAAYNFSGLCQTAPGSLLPNAVNFWHHDNACYSQILNALKQFDLPVFCKDQHELSSSMLISSLEFVSCLYT